MEDDKDAEGVNVVEEETEDEEYEGSEEDGIDFRFVDAQDDILKTFRAGAGHGHGHSRAMSRTRSTASGWKACSMS